MLLQYFVAAVCSKFKLLPLGPFIAWFYDYHSKTQVVARPEHKTSYLKIGFP